ncbi:MAG: DUF6020 family protein, partial [Oscillospiraceae bacterium]|nr:DUF6020 family protein [Oscillospiraceae bacterium]
MKLQEKTRAYYLISALCALLCAFFSPYLLLAENHRAISNGFFSVIIFFAFFFLFYKGLHKKNSHGFFYTYPLGLLFSVFSVFGVQLTLYHEIDFSDVRVYFSVFVFSFAFYFALLLLWDFLDAISGKTYLMPSKKFKTPEKITGFKFNPIFIWLGLLLCRIPVWLAVFPGFFCYDANMQLTQFRSGITAHHPPLHTFLLGGTVELVAKLTGSYNAGIAVYVFLQMAFICVCFAYAIITMRKWKIPSVFLYISF